MSILNKTDFELNHQVGCDKLTSCRKNLPARNSNSNICDQKAETTELQSKDIL